MKFNKALQSEAALDITIRTVLDSYLSPYGNTNPNFYNFRCNICGDSKKSKMRRRAFILKNNWPWVFYCHNCGEKISAVHWLKIYYPLFYRNYIKEILKQSPKQNTTEDKNINILAKQKMTDAKNIVLKKHNDKIIFDEKEDTKYFQSILSGDSLIFKLALSFCKNRQIPEDVWKTWYVATDGLYKNRIIIPFFNKKNIYYWQGRSLYSWMLPKYLSRKESGRQLNSIYNYYSVDKTKPIIALEGMIDSLYIENSIAMTGVNKTVDLKNIYWLLDNDTAGKEKSLQLLTAGEYVFCWKPFLKNLGINTIIKDINDLIIVIDKKRFTFEDLKPYFTNSIFNKIYFV